MYRSILILLSLIAQLASAQSFNLSWIDEDAQLKATAAKSWVMQKAMNSVTTSSGMDIKFHRILLTLDPAVRYVTGSVSTYFVPKSEPLHTIIFDLSDSLNVTGISYHSELLSSYVHQNNKLSITLPNGASGNVVIDSITVEYQGIPINDGSGSFALSTHAETPILYTLSEPYGAKDWWPCSQDLNDKIDSVHLIINVPPGNRAAANGMLVNEKHYRSHSMYEWKHKHPIAAYLVGVAVTNYAVYSDFVPVENGKPIEILNYVYPEDSANFRSLTPNIIKPFQLYNELFGMYPYADERYGHAQWNWGGGMEHQTMSFMGSFGYDLMAHELGHQWFGDFITCGSWKDIWLNEGFATYMTGICYERDQGGIYWEPFKRLSINRIIKEPGGSVYCYDTTNVDRIFDARLSYSKGAMVLHMLRWEMGDENFFTALNNYLHDPLLANGYAKTEDLIAHCEAVADTSYQEFFNDWVYGSGYPTYTFIYRKGLNNEIEVEVAQEQSDPSVGYFEMDLPVVVYGRLLEDYAVREGVPAFAGMTPLRLMTSATSQTYVLHNTHNGQVFKLSPGFAVDSIRFDPERWICTANAVVLGVPNVPLDQDIKVYPNPVTDQLTIRFEVPREGRYIRIYNQTGQLMYSGKSRFDQPLVQIPMGDFAKGIYMVEVEGQAAISVVKE